MILWAGCLVYVSIAIIIVVGIANTLFQAIQMSIRDFVKSYVIM